MRPLCNLEDIQPDHGLVVTDNQGNEFILVSVQNQIFGYQNRCPHANARLNMNGERIIALDGFHILCTVHGAHFHPKTGLCTMGPCKNQSLTAIDLTIKDAQVWLLTDPE